MNREIKFRAHTKQGIFILPAEDFSLMITDTGFKVYAWCSDGIFDEFDVEKLDEYTGLKDKNGKEIYEGDIVFDDYNECNWQVSFDKRGCFVAHDPNEPMNSVFLDDYDFEIIGNIYENPELLD